MRTALGFCVGLVVCVTQTAVAQPTPRVFVAGSIVADVKHFSGDQTTGPLVASALGGGGGIGTFIAPRWSVEFDVGVSKTATPMPSGVRSRSMIGSGVVGYHPAPIGRVELGYLAGLTFVRLTREFQVLPLATPDMIAPNPPSTFAPQARRQVHSVPGATLGIEARIGLNHHWAIVPDFRATAFGLDNGEGAGFFFRPGVSVRWSY